MVAFLQWSSCPALQEWIWTPEMVKEGVCWRLHGKLSVGNTHILSNIIMCRSRNHPQIVEYLESLTPTAAPAEVLGAGAVLDTGLSAMDNYRELVAREEDKQEELREKNKEEAADFWDYFHDFP